jgi:hypothetical protein
MLIVSGMQFPNFWPHPRLRSLLNSQRFVHLTIVADNCGVSKLDMRVMILDTVNSKPPDFACGLRVASLLLFLQACAAKLGS